MIFLNCKILLHLVDSTNSNWKDNYYIVRKELEKYGHNLNKKEEVIALSKNELNPENTKIVIDEMNQLNNNKQFSISSFKNIVSVITSVCFNCSILNRATH